MESFISIWNNLMVTAVFAGIVVSMALIYTLILPNDKFSKVVGGFVGKNILLIGFLISLAAVISSLVYSNVIGYPPCMLCWYARILFYPQLVLFGRALYKKDLNILQYSMILTVLGVLLLAYHSTIVITGESVLPCASSGVSCLSRDVFVFGFITIPFMGFVGFVSLLLSLLVYKKRAK